MAAARSSGRPQTVTSATTQTSVTVARPNGTFTTTSYVLPVRVRQHGEWTAVNAALRRTLAGRWRPAAVPSGLTLSGGGRGPLAVFASPAGGTLSVWFPAALPAPVITGATATYHAVLRGVDLRVTATPLGGLSEVLVVRDAAAAASPTLRRLRLPTHTTRLKLSADTAGNLTGVGSGGQPEFSGPAPVMWDSTSPARSAANASPAAGSSESGPGRRAHSARVGLAAGDGTLILTPDPALIRPHTAYPVYLGASVTPDTFTSSSNSTKSTQEGFVETQGGDGCQTYKNWDTSFTYGNGVGYQAHNPCYGLYRSYYAINVSNLDPSMHVQSATLKTWENYSADFNCRDTWPLTLYWASGAGPATSWDNPPKIISSGDPVTTDKVKPASNPGSSCSDQQANFNVTSIMKQAAAGSWHTWDLGLYGDETKVSSNYGFMRVGDNPEVDTVFDLTPNVPTGTHTTPDAHDTPGGPADPGCNQSGDWGWIGNRDPDLTLNAGISANITNEEVRALFSVWDNKDNGITIATPASNWYDTSGQVNTSIGITLKDGHQYGWDVAAYVKGVPEGSDGGYTSAESAYCHFNVDLTAPAVPAVTSADFPPSGSSPGTTKYAGDSGSFTFTSSDPVPTGCSPSPCLSSGVAYFEYSLNTPIPASGASNVPAATSDGVATATLSNLTVGDWGTNILYVNAVDSAGNVSQAYQYDFYVPWKRTVKVHPGDVNGDHIPDLLGTTSAGNLVLYPGNADPALAPVNASVPGGSPDNGTNWNSYQITHRGSFSQNAVDDLFAHKGPNLYAYFNNPNDPGATPQFGSPSNVYFISKPPCSDADDPGACKSYDSTDWSKVTQILAPGDAYSTAPAHRGPPGLLTVEKNQLWLYQDSYLLEGQPILLGSSGGSTGWSDMTLIAPGQVNGAVTIWARDNLTGAIYSYPISIDANGLPTLNPADPGSPPTATSGTIITPPGVSFTSSAYPAMASPGPLDNSSYPGLYAEDSSGKLWYYPGQAGSQPISSTPTLVGTLSTPVTQLS
jgi:hypothetical protein